AALDGGDAVGEGVEALVVARVPLQGNLDLLVLLDRLEAADALEDRLFRMVEVTHEVDDAARVLVGLLLLVVRPLVLEADLEALVEEGHDLQALEDRLGPELGALGLEDVGVWPEGDRRPPAAAWRPPVGRQ